jgi:glycosyltransferase involved in cell wall biosynthesis
VEFHQTVILIELMLVALSSQPTDTDREKRVHSEKRPTGVSFLVPVFNAEKCLPSLLEGILGQDQGDIEIVCVDDGSTDSSLAVLHSFEDQYPCIHVYSQSNSGASVARNLALSRATKQWICFVDSDDCLSLNAMEIVRRYVDGDADIVYFDYERFDSIPNNLSGGVSGVRSFNGVAIEKLQSDCINRLRSNTPLIAHNVQPTPWGKLYKREFLIKEKATFPEGIQIEEDVLFNFRLLSHVRKAQKIDYVLYHYRWSSQSISHGYRSDIVQNTERVLGEYRKIIEECYRGRADIAKLYEYRTLWELLYCVVLDFVHPDNPLRYIERRRQFKDLLLNPGSPYNGIFQRVRCTDFEPRQSILAVLIRFRMFLLLDLLGRIMRRKR